jgi:RNA polymerase sigma factor (sigma-70 family)
MRPSLHAGRLRIAIHIADAHPLLVRSARDKVRRPRRRNVDPADALSEAYASALEHAEEFRGDSPEELVDWVEGFLRREVLSLSRRAGYRLISESLPKAKRASRSSVPRELSTVASAAPGPQDCALRAERCDLVRAVLKKLESRDAQLVLAVLAEGKNASTVARELSPKRRSTVYRTLDRLRAELRRELGELD